METDEIISIQTDRPKFKVYQITSKGYWIAIDSKVKSGAIQEMKKSPELNRMLDEICGIILHQKQHPKIQDGALAITLASASEILLSNPSAAAHSKNVKKMFDSMDNQPSNTLSSTIEITTNAT